MNLNRMLIAILGRRRPHIAGKTFFVPFSENFIPTNNKVLCRTFGHAFAVKKRGSKNNRVKNKGNPKIPKTFRIFRYHAALLSILSIKQLGIGLFKKSVYSRGRSYRVRTVISFRKPCNGTPIFDREPRSNRDLLKE